MSARRSAAPSTSAGTQASDDVPAHESGSPVWPFQSVGTAPSSSRSTIQARFEAIAERQAARSDQPGRSDHEERRFRHRPAVDRARPGVQPLPHPVSAVHCPQNVPHGARCAAIPSRTRPPNDTASRRSVRVPWATSAAAGGAPLSHPTCIASRSPAALPAGRRDSVDRTTPSRAGRRRPARHATGGDRPPPALRARLPASAAEAGGRLGASDGGHGRRRARGSRRRPPPRPRRGTRDGRPRLRPSAPSARPRERVSLSRRRRSAPRDGETRDGSRDAARRPRCPRRPSRTRPPSGQSHTFRSSRARPGVRRPTRTPPGSQCGRSGTTNRTRQRGPRPCLRLCRPTRRHRPKRVSSADSARSSRPGRFSP